MKRLITSTAIAALLALPVYAQTADTPATPEATTPAPDAMTPAPDATTPMPDATTPAPDAMTPAPDAEMGSDNAMDSEMTDFDRENYATLAVEEVTVENMTGAGVYDANDDRIGEISDFVVDGDTITQAIIDVGGFLGLGEKPVSLDMAELEILQEVDGDDIRVYVSQTKEELEELPEYEE